MCKPYKEISIREPNYYEKHGLNIVLTVMNRVKYNEACVLLYDLKSNRVGALVREAIKDGATVINLSIGGKADEIQNDERLAILYALVHGIKIVISAGNESLTLTKDLCKDNLYIGCYSFIPSWSKYLNKNLFYIGHKEVLGTKDVPITSNRFPSVVYVREACTSHGFHMCGTSQSAAVFTNKLLRKELNKYANQ